MKDIRPFMQIPFAQEMNMILTVKSTVQLDLIKYSISVFVGRDL